MNFSLFVANMKVKLWLLQRVDTKQGVGLFVANMKVKLWLLQRVDTKQGVELDKFEQRLERINQDEKINIDNIGGLLIWDNANYE